MLKEPAKNATHSDVIGQTGHAWPQCAHAAHEEVDGHPGLARTVERVDHHLVDQRVALERDLRALAGPGAGPRPSYPPAEPAAHRLRGDGQAAVAALPAVPGELVEQVGDALADPPARREQ